MTRKARVNLQCGTVLELFHDDCVHWLHKDIYNSLLDVEDIVNSGDRVDIETGLKIADKWVAQPNPPQIDESSEDTPE